MVPDPKLLDKRVWKQRVLPAMALRLGLWADSLSPYPTMDPVEIDRVLKGGVFASQPLLHQTDWQKIVDYYVQHAPEHPLPQPAKPPVAVGLPLFQIRKPTQPIEGILTLLKADSAHQQIVIGSRRGLLYVLDRHLRVLDSALLAGPPADVHRRKDGGLDVLTLGNMDPNDHPNGVLMQLPPPGRINSGQRNVTLKALQRPVAAAYGDVNGDGNEDIVVCQFGHFLGRISWFDGRKATHTEHIIDDIPGARQALIRDFDGDGRSDIMVLFAQGDEQVAVYWGKGGGQFLKQTVLRFPSVYGSSDMDVVDFDGDGDLDILYANGDNADYSYELKPYHGVRLFRNEGKMNFREVWFYPMHGVTKALARDFDGDGDLDVAAIAFAPDFNQKPVESFVYLENKGGNQFRPATFAHPEQGSWLTMDAADIDHDGDEDILLGSFYVRVTPTPRPLMEQWRRSKDGVLLLENRSRSGSAGNGLAAKAKR